MNQKTLNANAETVEKAMESIKGRIPPGWFILSAIETPPVENKQRESADTIEEALEQARKKNIHECSESEGKDNTGTL